MANKKILLSIYIISALAISGNALEQREPPGRIKPIPLEELQNPKSFSYVPVPYPKTRDEIIADLKYAANRYFGRRKIGIGGLDDILGKMIEIIIDCTKCLQRRQMDKLYLKNNENNMLVQLLVPNSGVHVGEIVKVMNRSIGPDEFAYCITLKDREGHEVGRISLGENGSFRGGSFSLSGEKRFRTPLKSADEASREISDFVDPSEVKKMERIYMNNILAIYPEHPTWEIETFDNMKYYLDANGGLYKLQKRIEIAKDDIFFLVKALPNKLVIHDQLNGQLLFLDVLRWKNQPY